jgi:hypothetical protein
MLLSERGNPNPAVNNAFFMPILDFFFISVSGTSYLPMSKANPKKHIFPPDYAPIHGGHIWFTHGVYQFDRDVPFTDPDQHDYIRVTEISRATENAKGFANTFMNELTVGLGQLALDCHSQAELDAVIVPAYSTMNSYGSDAIFDFQWAIRRLRNRRSKQNVLT